MHYWDILAVVGEKKFYIGTLEAESADDAKDQAEDAEGFDFPEGTDALEARRNDDYDPGNDDAN